jgi:hypothetical protein
VIAMPLMCVLYVKSRPGATTTALGLAAALPPSARPVVVECDPAGGDLAARHGLTMSPGLVELATATRTAAAAEAAEAGEAAEALSRYAQRVRLGDRAVEVVVAPSGGAQTRVALSVLARPGHSELATADRTVIADCGRLDFSSAAWPLVGMADVVLLLARGRLDELAHLREHVDQLTRAAGDRLVVLLASGGVYGAEEITAGLSGDGDEIAVHGPLPYDERAAAVLEGSRRAGPRWQRRPLMKALRHVAAALPVATFPARDEFPTGVR